MNYWVSSFEKTIKGKKQKKQKKTPVIEDVGEREFLSLDNSVCGVGGY